MGFGLGFFVLPVLIGAIAVAISAVARFPAAVSGTYPAVARVHLRLVIWRIAGFIIALVSAIAFAWIVTRLTLVSRNDLVIVLGVPTVFSLIYLTCLLISERWAFRPATVQRTAGLGPRGAADYFSRPTAAVIVTATICAAAALAVQYDVVNAGTTVRVTCVFDREKAAVVGVDSASFALSATDRTSTVAIAVALALAATLAFAVAISAVRRARPDADLIAVSEDDALRRNSVRVACGIFTALVAIAGAVTSLPLATVLLVDFSPCTVPSWWHPTGTALMWSLFGWLVLFGWGITHICARPKAIRRSASIG